MALAQGMVDLIDERIAAHLTRATTAATVVERTGATTAMVTLDGSALPVPVKCFGDVNIGEGDRVGLVRLGVDWTIVGTFTRRRSLTIPDGALPSAARIVMGPDIPPELVAWATPKVITFLALQIFYYDATRYRFAGVGTSDGIIRYFEGTYDPVNKVYLTAGAALTGGAGTTSIDLNVGTTTAAFPLDYKFYNTIVSIAGSSVLDLAFGSQFKIDGTSQPRGLVARITSILSTPDIGVEAVAMTTPTMSFFAGRAYRVEWQGPLITSAPNQTTIRVRKNNLAGALLAEWNVPIASSGTNWQSTGYAYVRNSSGVDVTNTAVALTMAATAGISRFQGTTTSVATFEVTDAGAAADYANAIAI